MLGLGGGSWSRGKLGWNGSWGFYVTHRARMGQENPERKWPPLYMGTAVPTPPLASHPKAGKGGNWQLAINKLTTSKATC